MFAFPPSIYPLPPSKYLYLSTSKPGAAETQLLSFTRSQRLSCISYLGSGRRKKKKTGVELLVSCYIQASPAEESEIKKQSGGVCVCVCLSTTRVENLWLEKERSKLDVHSGHSFLSGRETAKEHHTVQLLHVLYVVPVVCSGQWKRSHFSATK